MVGHGLIQSESILPTIIRPNIALRKYCENAIFVLKTLFFSRYPIFSDFSGADIVEPSAWRRIGYGTEGLGEMALGCEPGHLRSYNDRFA
jgi:hypothetical protein